jgi:hypothetical protein
MLMKVSLFDWFIRYVIIRYPPLFPLPLLLIASLILKRPPPKSTPCLGFQLNFLPVFPDRQLKKNASFLNL